MASQLGIQALVEEENEQKFLDEIKSKELIDQKAWSFCLKEQHRLAKLGYSVPLSTIIWASGCLDSETLLSLHSSTTDRNSVDLVQVEIGFAEAGLPKIRNYANYEKRKKEKARAEMSPEDQMLQQLGEVLEETALDSFEEEKVESISASDALEEEDEEKVKDNDAEEKYLAKKRAKKRGKPILSGEEAIELLKKGQEVKDCYVENLTLSKEMVKDIVFTGCTIENLELIDLNIEGKVDFQKSTFQSKAVFRGSTFHKETLFRKCAFNEGADFAGVSFLANTHFNSAIFKKFVSYNRANFSQKAIFSKSYFSKGVKFSDSKFELGASFNDCNCDHRFFMVNCCFDKETSFSNAHLAHFADFSGTKFLDVIKFKSTQFDKWANFNNCEFASECHFAGAVVAGDLSFKWAKFNGLVNLRTLCGERNVDFHNAEVGENGSFRFLDSYFGRLFIFREHVENKIHSHQNKDYFIARKEYGLLKNNFREINEYEEEDWAYLMEKRMERMSSKIKGVRTAFKRFFSWLALDIGCGYGTRPLNIFLVSLAILMCFAGFYQCSQLMIDKNTFVLESNSKTLFTFIDAIQVSFRTFTNAEVGGWEARADSWMNYVMMFESFLGFFVMTVLVVTFSRKVIR